MSYNPKSLFSQIQKREQEHANLSVSAFANEHLFKPKSGTVVLRLLWLPPNNCDREYPMINSYVHKFYDPNATGKKFAKVVCPTSQYMLGETMEAFQKCPICKAVSEFYKNGQKGSKSAEEMYKTFRRTCEGYIPVYVVNGPEDVIGQVKILQYGKQFKDFFNRKIFGIQAKAKEGEEQEPIAEDEIIGLDAFMYLNEDTGKIVTEGYDLIITTTTTKMNLNGKSVNMPQYSLDFSRKPKSITEINNIDLTKGTGINYFKNINNDIRFDADFYVTSTDADLQMFKTSYITKGEIEESTVEEETSVETDNIVEEEEVETVKSTPTPKTKTKTKSAPITIEEQEEDIIHNYDGDVDVDAIIAGLKN